VTVDLLLKAGCNPAARNQAGETPLYLAAATEEVKVVQRLSEACEMRRIKRR